MTEQQDSQIKRNHARALWIEAAGRCVLRDERLPSRAENLLLIRTRFSGISRGTETLVFKGQVPQSEHDRMRAPFQEGAFSFPLKYGYSAVGDVEEGPAGLLGKTVFCLYPHQDRFVVSSEMVRVLPDFIPAARAVLAANMETALNISWDAHIVPGQRVNVLGAGVVGCLTAYIAAQIPGTEVTLSDIDSARGEIAESLGLHFAHPDHAVADADIVINASASGEALATAIECAGQEARIVEASWYGERQIQLSLGGAFHAKRLSIISSQVGAIPAYLHARWTYARRLAKAITLLADDRLDCLISGETPFAALPSAYADILSAPRTLCHRIYY